MSKEEVRSVVEQIYTETRVSIAGYLRYLGLSDPQSQEVLQEVYLRFYESLLGGKVIENRKAWLFRVAHNEALRAKKRDKAVRGAEPDWSRFVCPSDSPERLLLNQEQTRQVKHALASLSLQQRHCLYLRAEGLRYREIAETLGISVSSVNEFLRRALSRLVEVVNA
jgi:RNA polymerase sigma-70 factor (ECF subfamily)